MTITSFEKAGNFFFQISLCLVEPAMEFQDLNSRPIKPWAVPIDLQWMMYVQIILVPCLEKPYQGIPKAPPSHAVLYCMYIAAIVTFYFQSTQID